MNLPLSSSIEFTVGVDLALAWVLGIGFGFCLERAGFGSARKLTAVFYLYDMAVVKVMFTAIVTAMAGLFVLSAAGLLDGSLVGGCLTDALLAQLLNGPKAPILGERSAASKHQRGQREAARREQPGRAQPPGQIDG